MSVEHVLPSTINDGLIEDFVQPDAVVTRFETGGRMSRHWTDRVLKSYSARIVPMDFSADDIAELKAFARHVQQIVYPFWMVEPWLEDHHVFCGGLANGSMTTFVLPIRSYSSIYGIYDDDVYVASTDYTLHAAANLIAADDDANVVDSIGNITNEGGSTTVARYLGDAVDGRACVKVTQAAAANNGLKLPSQAVASSTKYTFHIFFKGSGTFKVRIVENDGGTTTTDSSGLTGNPAAWQQETVTVTTTGTTTAVDLKGIRTESTAATWFAACLGYARGDNVRWFLPSVAPPLVELDTAPVAGSRVGAVGKGYLMVLVAIDRGGLNWLREEIGHAAPRTFKCTEVVER
jgi:hypothetical protein